jgi:glycosyltransferase involved in cell wall biosynthesis
MIAAAACQPTVHVFSDILVGLGGIETYLDALARRLHAEGRPFRIAVSLNGLAPFLDDLETLGVSVYRQPYVPGDRWCVRQRLLVRHVSAQLQPGDWIFCVRQPMPGVYLSLVRAAHARGAKIAVSWIFAPEFLPPPPGRSGDLFCQAVHETDAVISVSQCTEHQFRAVYGYEGPVQIVPYHNVSIFDRVEPLPSSPPYKIGFIGRVDIEQKNLDTVIDAFGQLASSRDDVELHVYGGGPDLNQLRVLVEQSRFMRRIVVHGPYDQRRDLRKIIAECHVFIYVSRFEGGPCFSLLELLQAGRYVVTSPVGGIPDIYQGRPDIGLMISPRNPRAIAEALDEALVKIAYGRVDPTRIRARYDEAFSMSHAHAAWLRALDLGAQQTQRPPLQSHEGAGPSAQKIYCEAPP